MIRCIGKSIIRCIGKLEFIYIYIYIECMIEKNIDGQISLQLQSGYNLFLFFPYNCFVPFAKIVLEMKKEISYIDEKNNA